MATPRDIVRLAFRDCGVLGKGQSLAPEDMQDGLTTLNQMIAQWRRRRWLVYRLEDLAVTSTGAQSYTVGPAPSDIVCDPRPDRLEFAYVRQLVNSVPNQPDYVLRILEAREDYASIVMKQIGNFPYCIWYDSNVPQGAIYPYPIPQASLYAVHILVKQPIAEFTSLSDTIMLPPEYEFALRYQLAVTLCPSYGREPSKQLLANAKVGLQTVRGANMQIKRLTMPGELVRPSVYNPYSDQFQ